MKTLWPDNLNRLSKAHQDALSESLRPDFERLLEAEKITPDAGMRARLANLYLPLAAWLAAGHRERPLVVGINGAQGSGKSTLTHILALLLERGFDKRVLSLSIDDLYKTRAQRRDMAETVHPLFITRGVPGTHDLDLGLDLFKALKDPNRHEAIPVPRFNKAKDDRDANEHWKRITPPVDIVLFEGWCVGAVAEDETALSNPVNTLEAQEDPQGIWRRYVNAQLGGPYRELFAELDILIMLQIPDMQYVYTWRRLQEHKLAAAASGANIGANRHIMSDAELERFIMHYERITRAVLKEMPARADIVMRLDADHQVAQVIAGAGA